MRALATCGLFTAEAARASVGSALGEASRTLDSFQCGAVVLDAAVSPGLLAAWTPQLAAAAPRVAALHAPCPAPQTSRSDRLYAPEDLRLAAGDGAERAEAVTLVQPTLDAAALAGAPVVVVEGGPLPLGTALAALETYAERHALDGTPARHVADTVRALRLEAGRTAVDGLSFALEMLLPAVEERGLRLILAEQRGLAWAGSRGELGEVLRRFAGAPIGWWADPGGRRAAGALLSGWDEGPEPAVPAEGVWWRLPAEEESWGIEGLAERLDIGALDEAPASAFTHVLSPGHGRLRSWHRHVWDALPF